MTVVELPSDSRVASLILETSCPWLICCNDLNLCDDQEIEPSYKEDNGRKVITPSSDNVRVKRVLFPSQSHQKRQIREFAQRLNEWHSIPNHEHLISLLTIGLDESPAAFFVSPWVGRGTNIMEYLRENPTHDKLLTARELAEAVRYLHDPKKGWDLPIFVHGDIRGENIFVRPGGSCYLGEFSLTCIEPVKEDLNTPAAFEHSRWMAPELLNPKAFASYPTDAGSFADSKFRTCNDIYSLASAIFEIFTGEAPYYQYSNNAFVTADVLRGVLPSPRDPEKALLAGLTNDIQQLLECMWRYSPTERPGAAAVCRILRNPAAINKRRPQRLAPVFAATAAAAARRLYM